MKNIKKGMQNTIGVIVIVCLFLGLGYSTSRADEYKDAKKAYEMGKNDDALNLLVVKIKKDNDHQEAIALLEIILPLVIDKYTKSAQDYEFRKDWDKAFAEYETLIRINDMISSITPLKETKVDRKKVKKPVELPKIDVRTQRDNVINNAAETHYQKGVSFMQTVGNSDNAVAEFYASEKYIPDYKDSRALSAEAFYRDGNDLLGKKDYKNAVKKFRRCQGYIPEYKNSSTLAAQAKQSAIRRVAIMPFTNLSGKTEFGDVGQILTDLIISEGVQSQPEFLEFVTREYLQQIMQEQATGQNVLNESSAVKVGKLTGIHAFVFGKVLSIIVSYPPDITINGESSSQWIINGQPTNFYASWIKHTRQGYVEIRGSFQIVDVEKGTIVKSENVTKRIEDRAQWVTFQGDERAIEQAVKSHNTTGERSLEPAGALVDKAMAGIATDLTERLTNFFK